MELKLKDKVFLISGSSRGIGKGIAQILLEEGARVVITGRDTGSVEETFHQFHKVFPDQVIQSKGDLNSSTVLNELSEKTLKAWNRIDGMVANAGSVKPVPDWEIADDEWEWYFETNFKVAHRFVIHFIPHLKKTSGSIIMISSIAGLEDIGAPLPYSASKAALTMYAKGLARKLANDRIRVNTVSPGNILFPGGNWDKKQKASPENIQKILEEKVPLNTFGTPEDIGNIVAFLLSEKAKFITGSCFVVDGGQTLLVS